MYLTYNPNQMFTKLTYVLALCLILSSCGQNSKKEQPSNKEKTTEKSMLATEVGIQNFAVIWKWTTNNVDLVNDNVLTISKEFDNLWRKGVIENAYYNSNAKHDKFEHFPNISFFIKAKSVEDVKTKLNELTVVKKGIAFYQIFPVGHLWLDRKRNTIDEKGLTKSYVTVWKTEKKPTEALVKKQTDEIMKLWNAGKIENVYFDIEGTQTENNKEDFVFYANANTEEEARALCESLPFFKEQIASFNLFDVGTFWLGIYNEENK